ncbi:MAG: hypothetical protein SNG35_01965 [Rikenellaceae bacterium]
MKRVIIAILLMAMPFVVDAQKKAQREADNDTAQWRYEIERVDLRGTGVVGDGTVVPIKVWSFSEKPEVAQAQAYKNAVHGVIFKGVPMLGRVPGIDPLCPNLAVETQNAEYFRAFFANGGPYMRFCSNSGKGINTSTLKIDKKTYKVGVNVIVNVEALRQELERAGVIKKLGGRF